ncbi:hypothetical protein [Nocardiopsis dassonvillei]|uniref:hypothetical protein n=1 Tax=Nocardiopsis dassonvillei TaxID=2014 RepID=UPI0033D104DF
MVVQNRCEDCEPVEPGQGEHRKALEDWACRGVLVGVAVLYMAVTGEFDATGETIFEVLQLVSKIGPKQRFRNPRIEQGKEREEE